MPFSFHTHLLCACLLLVLFYDSGGKKIPFPQEHRHFLCDGGQRRDRRIPPPLENCPQETAPGRLPPLNALGGGGVGLGLGLSNSPGAIFQGAILLVPAKGKPHFKAKFSPSKNRTVTWQNAYPSKRACWF